MQFLNRIILSFFLGAFLLCGASTAVPSASAANLQNSVNGSDSFYGAFNQKTIGTTTVSKEIIADRISLIIGFFLGFLGIIAVGLMLYAGWLYLSAHGDSKQTEKAMLLLQQAFIGLIIIFSSWGVAAFIISQLSGIIFNGSAPGGPSSSSGGGAIYSGGTTGSGA